MNKHTAGPWTCGTVESNETRYTQPIFSNGQCVAVVYGGTNHTWTDEDRANAIAISALPQLLAVVRLVVDSQGWDGNDPNDDKWTHFYARAKFALEAVDGRGGN